MHVELIHDYLKDVEFFGLEITKERLISLVSSIQVLLIFHCTVRSAELLFIDLLKETCAAIL